MSFDKVVKRENGSVPKKGEADLKLTERIVLSGWGNLGLRHRFNGASSDLVICRVSALTTPYD